MAKFVYFKPYQQENVNAEYNGLFCDNLALYRNQSKVFREKNWNVLLTARPRLEAARQLTLSSDVPARLRVLAFNYLAKKGQMATCRELLGVILEAGVDDGLETLAAYTDYEVNFIDSRGNMRKWQAAKLGFRGRLVGYFASAAALVEQLRPSDKPRFPPPFAGMARITMLVSDGLCFGQGPGNQLTKDTLSAPVIRQANNLLARLLAQEKQSE